MKAFLKISRAAVLLFVSAFLAACSQTTSGVSSYGGKLGISSELTKKQQQTKKLAARKRAKAKSIAKRKAFTAKRKARLNARKTKSSRKTTLFTKRGSKKLKKKRVSKRKVSKRKKTRLRKTAHKKSRKRRIKKSTYAYVGGRSKGIKRSSTLRCVPRKLRRVISQISRKYGRVTINSTHRSRRYNRRVGGKRRSYHLRCRAIDFRVHGRTRGLTRWLSRHPSVGGYKRYRSGFYHIDNGPRRTW
jgi:uncharacterized protein YcbK (DUF882 family)